MNPKECRAMKPRLQRFADGELPREEAALVRSHLLDCISCRMIAGEVYAVRRFFPGSAEPSVPPGFAARVAAQAFAERIPAREVGEALSWVRGLAAIAAGVLVLSGLYLAAGPSWTRGRGIEAQAGGLDKLDREIEAFRKEQERLARPEAKPAAESERKQ